MVLTRDYTARPAGRMLPLTQCAVGLVVVFGAFRVNGFDLLVDPVGWVMCAMGASRLERSAHGAFSWAMSCAASMVLLSIVALVVTAGNGAPSFMRQALGLVSTAVALLAVWLLAEAVIRRLRPFGLSSTAALLDVLRWAVAGLGAAGMLVGYGYGYGRLGPIVAIASIVAFVALIVVLFRSAKLPCLAPAAGTADPQRIESGLP